MAEGNLSHRSESESIRTEEFVTKFEDIVKDEENPRHSKINSSISHSRQPVHTSSFQCLPPKYPTSKMMATIDNGELSDSESIKTEDFQNEFKKSLTQYSESLPNFEDKSLTRSTLGNIGNQFPKPTFSDSTKRLQSKTNQPLWSSKSSSNLHLNNTRESFKPISNSWTVKPTLSNNSFKSRLPLARSHSREELFNYIPDPEVDSIMTEDYENRFNSILSRGGEVGHPPIKSFDDSFLGLAENARTHKLKDRVAHHFNIPSSHVKLPEQSKSLSYGSFDIDKRFEEIMDNRRRNESTNKNTPFTASNPSTLSRALTLPRSVRFPGQFTNRNPHRIPLSATRTNVFSPLREVNSPDPNFSRDIAKQTPFYEEADYASEIKARSRQVQKEIEEERRKITRTQSLPPAEKRFDVIPSNHGTPRESLDKRIVELDQLTRSVLTAKLEKERLTEDIAHLEETMRRHQAGVRLSEKLATDNRTRADETHSELSEAERRRDQTMRELNRMNEQLERTKNELDQYEDNLRTRVHEIKSVDNSAAFDREEIDKITAERDELYNLIQKNDSAEQEKYELQKQINSLKGELMDQQEKFKDQLSSLEEELETSFAKLLELRREKEMLQTQLSTVEERFRYLQDEYNKSELETKHLQIEYENKMRTKLEELEKEKQKLEGDAEAKEKLRRLQVEYDRGYKMVEQLRDQIHNFECEITSLRHSNSKLKEENENRILRFEEEKRSALQSQRDELVTERANAMGELRSRFEKNKTMTEEHLLSELAEFKNKLINRDEELGYLKESYRQQDIKIKHMQEEFKVESREKIREALKKERLNWEKDEKERWSRELDELKRETDSKLSHLKEKDEKYQADIRRLENQVDTLQKELKAEKKGFESTLKKCKEDALRETEHTEQLVRKEMEIELKRLTESLSGKDEECRQLSHKCHKLKIRDGELAGSNDRLEKTIVSEINEECTKMAHILGVSPRKVNLSDSHSEKGDISNRSRGFSVTTALANLEACGEEMRSYVQELKFQVKELRNNREVDMKALRKQLKSENLIEIQEVREKLLKEHLKEINRLSNEPKEGLNEIMKEKNAEIEELRKNMQSWKEETTERLASKLKDEFKKEFEKKFRDLRQTLHDKDQTLNVNKREMDKLSREVKSLKSGSNGEIKPGLIAQLQENIKKLREENVTLSKSVTSNSRRSSGLIEPSPVKKPEKKDFNQRILEQKLLDAELKAKAAEQRVKDLEMSLKYKSGSMDKMSLRSFSKDSIQSTPLTGSVDNFATPNGVSKRNLFQ